MASWTFFQWISAVAAVFGIIGVLYGFWSGRKRQTDTKNIATNSRDVTQKGGAGVTHNEATDSTNVKQSGK